MHGQALDCHVRLHLPPVEAGDSVSVSAATMPCHIHVHVDLCVANVRGSANSLALRQHC